MPCYRLHQRKQLFGDEHRSILLELQRPPPLHPLPRIG